MTELVEMVGWSSTDGLTVIRQAASIPGKPGAAWHVRCGCGRHFVALGQSLRKRHVRSCGCRRRSNGGNRLVHGGWGTPEYQIWLKMKERCLNPRTKHYKNYGGRGITVCEEWRHDFPAFLAEVGKRPSPDLTLDRIDVDGNYEPGNIRWATRSEQSRNQRRWSKKTAPAAHLTASTAGASTTGG